jgi:hypothetical protein
MEPQEPINPQKSSNAHAFRPIAPSKGFSPLMPPRTEPKLEPKLPAGFPQLPVATNSSPTPTTVQIQFDSNAFSADSFKYAFANPSAPSLAPERKSKVRLRRIAGESASTSGPYPSSSAGTTKEAKKAAPSRPPNAFVLYRRDKENEMRMRIQEANERIASDIMSQRLSDERQPQTDLSKELQQATMKPLSMRVTASLVAEMWKNESEAVRQIYIRRAEAAIEEFRRDVDPDYGKRRNAKRKEKSKARQKDLEDALSQIQKQSVLSDWIASSSLGNPERASATMDSSAIRESWLKQILPSSDSATSISSSGSFSEHSQYSGIGRIFGSNSNYSCSDASSSQTGSKENSKTNSEEDLPALFAGMPALQDNEFI